MYEPDKMRWEDDMPFLLQIKNGFIDNSRVEIMEEPMNLRAFYTRISQLNLMIGMRLHATLLALRSGVPSININYTLKGRDIFNDMGLGDYVIELEQFIKDPLTVTGRIDDALYNKELKQSIDLFVKKASESNLSALKSIFKIKE
jgi:polysaccharide pyruvyl transferase WcaK-like protein